MNFMEIFSQLQETQTKCKALHHSMTQLQATGEAGAGAVKATVNGHNQLLSITIDPAFMHPDEQETLQDLIVAAVNLATKAAADKVKETLRDLAPHVPFDWVDAGA